MLITECVISSPRVCAARHLSISHFSYFTCRIVFSRPGNTQVQKQNILYYVPEVKSLFAIMNYSTEEQEKRRRHISLAAALQKAVMND